MIKRTQVTRCQCAPLEVAVEDKEVQLRFGLQTACFSLRDKNFLAGLNILVAQPEQISSVQVRLRQTTFSVTRQVRVVLQTLSWVRGIKVNGQRKIFFPYTLC